MDLPAIISEQDRGITQRTFDAWNRRQGLPERSVRGISNETADEIRAVKFLQRVIGMKTDEPFRPQAVADCSATAI